MGVFPKIFRTAFLQNTSGRLLHITNNAYLFLSFLKNVLLFWEEATEKYKRSGVTKHSFKVETKRSLGKKDFLVTM